MQEAPGLIHTLLQQLSAVFTREADQILQAQLGIGFSQYKILSALQENPTSQQKQIAFFLGQTEASVSRQVALLKDKGLLETKLNPSNRREHLTSLTVKGTHLIELAQTTLLSFQVTSLAHLPIKQQAQLLELLASLHQ